jgi:hypothetical protein
MNVKRFEFLGRVLSKYAANPDCIPYEKIVAYIKEYNNLLMQAEAERNRNKDIERESETMKTDIHFQNWNL